MDLAIEAIKFNHDLGTKDSLTIRKNADEDIEVPEWQYQGDYKPPKTSAAAYAGSQGRSLTIAVQLRRSTMSDSQSVEVSATSGGILGNVGKDTIIFAPGQSVSDFKVFDLKGARIGEVGVGKWNVVWDWTLKTVSAGGIASFERTHHVIYTLAENPKLPWGQPGDQGDYELPWTDALDWACCWAAGATDRSAIASRITTAIHNFGLNGKLKFEEQESFSRLSFNGMNEFDCTKFLEHLNNSTEPELVNCTDCAILVSTFANLLGCALYQSEMGYRFYTNPIRMIGFTTQLAREFRYHEVAWEDPCTQDANLFDSCLEVDGDLCPAGGEFKPILAINLPLGDEKGTDYHFRLVQRGAICEAHDDTKKRRRIARKTVTLAPIHPMLEQILKDLYDFSSWKQLPSPGRLFLSPVEKLIEDFSPDAWKMGRSRKLDGESGTPSLSESFWKSSNGETELRLLTYKCASVSNAHAFLLNLLGQFQFPVVKRALDFRINDERAVIGDIVFSGPQDRMLLFTRSNIVVFIQNGAYAFSSVSAFAHEFDSKILRALESERTGQVQSASEQSETKRRKPQTIKSTDVPKKEMSTMATNFANTEWSSIRPIKSTPTDMRRDGVIIIEKYDPITGVVEGRYYDVIKLKEKPLAGSIKSNGGNSHLFALHHVIPGREDFKRLYEGQTIADDGQVSIVGGRWTNIKIVSVSDLEPEPAAPAAQEEGVWVATKP